MFALFQHQGIEPGPPRLSGDHIDMTSQARDFEDHRLESPYTDEDIDYLYVFKTTHFTEPVSEYNGSKIMSSPI